MMGLAFNTLVWIGGSGMWKTVIKEVASGVACIFLKAVYLLKGEAALSFFVSA